MFNRNTLEGILSSFTKAQTRLDNFAEAQEALAARSAEEALLASTRETAARLQANKARNISGKINALIN